MSDLCCLSLLILPTVLLAQSIEFLPNHTHAVYSCGEEASLTIRVLDVKDELANRGTLKVSLTSYDKPLSSYTFDLSKGNPVTVKGTLSKPGFMKCLTDVTVDSKRLRPAYGLAFDPLKIEQGAPCPADFDAFWDQSVEKLAREVPLDPKMEKIDRYSSDRHTAYRVSFATFYGQRVHGFLMVPAGQGKGPFPVMVQVPGAGLGTYAPTGWGADHGRIVMIMCVHTFAPAFDRKEQQRLYDIQDRRYQEQYGVPRYCQAGAIDREKFFYYPVILGINRAVDWLAARPEADKSRFYYTGTSQGGGFGFYLCGLNKNFTKGVSHVPALTDLLGYKKDRRSGWPRLVESQREKDRAAAEKVAPYFDAANFARRISCPYRVSVGFVDESCPPMAVYSGYNAIPVKDKAIVHGIGMTHRVFPEIYGKLDAWIWQGK